ncbi:hypothetical protein FG386_003074 [Cryptosporidium ryanae]|uniref:uncharacterized protein n=1 Tax=Cryptosporidium ryanae TaxID=515981 RepID=UPI00351A513C|nr:hypothetical protein FG386_003074 [Cryptosporidium ryanae]
MLEYEKNCTLLVPPKIGVSAPTSSELQKKLEDPSDTEKCKALRELIIWMTHGESYSRLLMTVIRYVVQSNNHKVKKYLQLYWEIVEKCNSDGTLKEEMILVCNALRNDLQHPNEYIRGSTLRLLCNLRFIKLIQPLIESIIENLKHRHFYVRRNAVMCIYSIIKTFGVEVIPNAVDEVEKLLLIEGDISTKRNAFLVLTYCDVERSLRYILSIQDNVTYMGDAIQLLLLELLGNIYCDFPNYRNNLLQLIINIVQSGSLSVSYEGANTLIKIGNVSPNSTIKIAIQAYINILLNQSDNNIRYIVLNKVSKITSMTSALYTLQRCFVKDLLRVLLCSNCYSIQIKIINIVMNSLLTKNNCLDIFQFILKHLQEISNKNTNNTVATATGTFLEFGTSGNTGSIDGNNADDFGGNLPFGSGITFHHHSNNLGINNIVTGGNSKLSEKQQFQQYQLILIKSIHEIIRKYHIVTFNLMLNSILINFITCDNPIVVNEITQFLKEMVVKYPNYQGEIVERILLELPHIQFSRPVRTCLWILSECNYDAGCKISEVITTIDELLKPLPLNNALKNDGHSDNLNADTSKKSTVSVNKKPNTVTKTVILEDGTYGTQDIETNTGNVVGEQEIEFHSCVKIASCDTYLRNLIVKEDDLLLMTSVAVSIVKLLLFRVGSKNEKENCNKKDGNGDEDYNLYFLGLEIYNKALYIIVCFLKYCMENAKSGGLVNDTSHRLSHCYIILKSLYSDLSHINQSETGGVVVFKPSKKTVLLKDRLFPMLRNNFNDKALNGATAGCYNFENKGSSKLAGASVGERLKYRERKPFQTIIFRQIKERLFSNNVDVLQVNDDDCYYSSESTSNVEIGNTFYYGIENDFSGNCFQLNTRSSFIGEKSTYSSKRIFPITGINDPIFIEAIIQVHNQDVLLELIVTNQSSRAIQNIQIELYPYGNLRIMEKPQQINHLEPLEVIHVYAISQVKSIETGILFGFVTFQMKNNNGNASAPLSSYHSCTLSPLSSSSNVSVNSDIVILNEINIQLIDFITNSNIQSSLFRQLWSEFEWENKIPIHSNCDSFIQFLRYLIKETKLSIVGNSLNTENNELILSDSESHLHKMEGQSSFFAVNLYAKSIFGEDALVNISLEKQIYNQNKEKETTGFSSNKDKFISGTVRIRSRTQGIALSLGDHIVSLQRKVPRDSNKTGELAVKKKGNNYYSRSHSQLLNIDFGDIH